MVLNPPLFLYVPLYAIIMKLLFTTLITLLLFACDRPISLSKSTLTGKCALEITEYSPNLFDTTITVFETDSTYYRIGTLYLKEKGVYKIQNDSIQIKYGISNNEKRGLQFYIINKNKQLLLVKNIDDNGNITTNNIIDNGIVLLKFDALKNKLHKTHR